MPQQTGRLGIPIDALGERPHSLDRPLVSRGSRKGLSRADVQTLIGLLAATGMHVGEALALDRRDIDVAQRVLTIRLSKFGKSRELPVHRSTIEAQGHYLCHGDRPGAATSTPPVFVS